MKNLADTIRDLREDKGWSLAELAKKIKVSRSYLSLLENSKLDPPKIPSLRVLRELVNIFSEENALKTFHLIVAALDYHSERGEAFAQLLGWLPEESERQSKENIEEIWVLSDRLAENIDEGIYKTTKNNIVKKKVKYVFFIPFGSQEWNYLKANFEHDVEFDILKEYVMCIESNPIMFFSRMGILNPGELDAMGTLSIGPVDNPQFYALEPKKVAAVHEHLNSIVRRFKKNIEEGEKTSSIKLPTGEFKLIFPKLVKEKGEE